VHLQRRWGASGRNVSDEAHFVTHLLLLPVSRVALMFSLAAFSSGCDVINGLKPVSESVAPAQVSSPAGHVLSEENEVSDVSTPTPIALTMQSQLAQPVQETSPEPWLLQPGLFAISHGLWLTIGALTLGGAGTVLGILSWQLADETNALLFEQHEDFQGALKKIEAIGKSRDSINEQLAKIKHSIDQLEKQDSETLLSLKQESVNTTHPRQGTDFESMNLIRPPVPSPPPPLPPSTPIPTHEQVLAELTAAVNRSDRQAFKNEIRAQLNITSNSENDISMGRLTQTQLEPVSGGGSYWLAMVDDTAWLFPTEQTLKGFAQLQPSKGIFKYFKEAIPSPQVIAAARLTADGQYWQIEEMGSIAIPG